MGKDWDTFVNELKPARPNDRKQVNLYMSEQIFRRFKRFCGDVSPSVVVEAWMKSVANTTKQKTSRKKK